MTCIITAILGYNNQRKKNLNTFNKIKTFKYSKIFAWKYKTTQKALKSNLNSCFEGRRAGGGGGEAEVLGHFPRIIRARRLPSDGSIVKFRAFRLLLSKAVLSFCFVFFSPPHERLSSTGLYTTAVCHPLKRTSLQSSCLPPRAPISLTRPDQHTHRPWVSCSVPPKSSFLINDVKKKEKARPPYTRFFPLSLLSVFVSKVFLFFFFPMNWTCG